MLGILDFFDLLNPHINKPFMDLFILVEGGVDIEEVFEGVLFFEGLVLEEVELVLELLFEVH